jgi:hypothetical protein
MDTATERKYTKAERKYKFWLETKNKGYLAWEPLTQKEAINMYRMTDMRQSIINPDPVIAYGWEETKSTY